MAACSLGRCGSLARSRLCAGTYLSRSWQPLGGKTPTSSKTVTPLSVCSRWYSHKEPASGYLYTKNHEYVSIGDPSSTTIGISFYAQDKLGEIVYVELPEVGQELQKGDVFGTLESVKAAADVNAPVGGTVTEVNSDLTEDPDFVNQDPYNRGWLAKLKDVNQEDFKDLMTIEDYEKFIEGEV